MRFKRKVWMNKGNGQKLVTIPKDCDIGDGDYVWISSTKTNTKNVKGDTN